MVDRIRDVVEHGSDRELNRINALAFAAAHGFDEEITIAAFLHAAPIGVFEMAWNVLAPAAAACSTSNATLKTVHRDEYHCSLCAAATSRPSTRWSR